MMTTNLKNRIEEALNEIRPYLIADGGNISLIDIVDNKHVKVRLEGSCTHCNVNHSTMKAGVETTIKKYIPEIETVENVLI